jgi:hypothetical protein
MAWATIDKASARRPNRNLECSMSESTRDVGVAIEEGLATIRDALSALSYGSLVLTVHEGRLVQIDVTQRKRFKLN